MREGGRNNKTTSFGLFLVCLCIRGLNRSVYFVQCIFILVTSKTLTLYDTRSPIKYVIVGGSTVL